MLSGFATKLALRKAGIKSDTFDFSGSQGDKSGGSKKSGFDEEPENSTWAAWMNPKKLPLTVQPWLAPAPPPVPVATCPKIGDVAPLDRDRQLEFGGGRRVIVLFMRCVGCAFAQKSFLALRTIANRYQGNLTCIAVSHSSKEATRKWVDLLGGAWNIQVVIDEDRAVYAAWGLGLGSVWYMFNPTTQMQGWKEKGWLGEKVASSITRTGSFGPGKKGPAAPPVDEDEGPGTVLGNKWQQAGLFAIDGRGTVVWAEKALRPDDLMDMDAAVKVLGL